MPYWIVNAVVMLITVGFAGHGLFVIRSVSDDTDPMTRLMLTIVTYAFALLHLFPAWVIYKELVATKHPEGSTIFRIMTCSLALINCFIQISICFHCL